MKMIQEVILHNFKRFRHLEISLKEGINILIGENEAGKSTILSAVNLVLSGSRNQYENIGTERLLNTQAVADFLESKKKYEDLPVMYAELWLSDQQNFEINGKNNSRDTVHDGLCMWCAPNDSLSVEIKEILQSEDPIFPFDYYTVSFATFQGSAYSGYKRFLKHIMIDTALIGTDYAVREYVRSMYDAHVSGSEQNRHQYEYRKAKQQFREQVLSELNERTDDCSFAIKTDPKTNLLTDMTLLEHDIPIDNKGKGRQCFVKTDFALNKTTGNRQIDIILIEEPENHLSHINMKKLIQRIKSSEDQQIIIATHNNMISARLDLRNTILLHTSTGDAVSLSDLPPGTAKFFIKAPDHGILDFVLSKKVILVEGDAEYILMERFYEAVTGKKLEEADVHILAVDGTTFKRYLDIAKLLGIKVAVMRDNDRDYQTTCVSRYSDYQTDSIRVFADQDNTRHTFEVCMYLDNQALCDDLFGGPRLSLSVQDYMIKNKTETALALLETDREVSVPQYIKEAIEWISA